MVPALGMRRRGRQPRRGERRLRWGCDASTSPGSGRVGRRGRFSPHHAGGPGGGRRRSCAIANPGHGNVVVKRGPDAGGVGARHPRLQDFNLGTLITGAGDDHPTLPIVTLETLPSEGRA